MRSAHNGATALDDGFDIARDEDGQPHVKRSWLRALIQDFDPIWFTWSMNFGIIAILMHQYNYQFPGLQVLATIAFMFDFVLFIIFSLIFLSRFVWFKMDAYNEIVNNMSDLPLIACWPIAFMTVVAFVGLTVSQSYWGGHAFTIVAYAMWWFGATWMVSTLLFVFIVTINRGEVKSQDLTPATVIPAVGVATVATIGGLICSYSTDISARLAVPIIIAAFCAVGIGIVMAIMLYSFIFHQLLREGWPAPDQTATMFMFVGPMGQLSAALQELSSAASTYHKFGEYDRGIFLTEMAAGPLRTTCVLLALMLTGMAAVWLFIAFYAMVYRAYRRELRWTLSCNAIIFPTGTLATSTLLLGIELHSPFFKVITGILIVFFVLVLLTNLIFTVWKIYQGEILIVREDPRVHKKLQQEEKEQ